MLNSYIVSASIHDRDVNNLQERVSVTFTHLTLKPQVRDWCVYKLFWFGFCFVFFNPKTSTFACVLQEKDKVHCVFWSFNENSELVIVFPMCASGVW